jgi:serine/threonine protein kinase
MGQVHTCHKNIFKNIFFNYLNYFISAGAMQAMVSKGIVHRDLKPQNILLSHDGRTKNPMPQDITLKIGEQYVDFLINDVMHTAEN